jgi:hypothetical protein
MRLVLLAAALVSGCSESAQVPSSGFEPATGGVAMASGGQFAAGGADGSGGGVSGSSGATTGGVAASSGGASVSSGGSTASGGGTASGGALGGGGQAGSAFSTKKIAASPSYSGSVNNGAACTTPYKTAGFEPVDPSGARHPLFLYFVGTAFIPGDASATYTSEAASKVTEAMARRGFVAFSVEYDNGPVAWISDHVAQLACLFGSANSASLLAGACALPNVDCDLGIATWGHSQGALVAHLAANSDARVRAVWATGYGGDVRATLAPNRFRVVNGEGDTTNGLVASLNSTAGFTSAECPDDGRKECLRADGSGWIIVQRVDCRTSTADHCWFDKRACTEAALTLEPNWIDPVSTKPFALERNADWVAGTIRRP